ncbi:L-gulonolactone oxidase-like [Babylonia areolata]|uniref:L-gulonolactone oxidase-like n=1 Tax=Babylonia areolata TaxID=304850 RepID=UPI003FD1FCA6
MSAADTTSQGRTGHHFTNWSGTQSCHPELYFEPETTEEIRQILTRAREKGRKVRVVGNGHSFSDLVCTTDYMISMCRYNQVLKVDEETREVTVQAGILVEELNNNVLPSHGLAMRVIGVVSDVTVAGLMSTGTHGSRPQYGTASSQVLAVELMTASGEVMRISKTENSELLPAVVLSLGALGVILTVTLQCEPAFRLHNKPFTSSLKDVLPVLEETVATSDYFYIEAFPHTDGIICHRASRTSEAPWREPQGTLSSLWTTLLGASMMPLLWLCTYLPKLIPLVSRFYFRYLYARISECIDSSHKIQSLEGLPNHYVMEWAIAREHFGTALMELQSWLSKSGCLAHFPIFCRFVKSEDVYLSPAYGRDTCYINIIIVRPYDMRTPFEEYWEAIERIVAPLGGRPHWAKDHGYGGQDFERLYPKWGEFCRLRKRLDPNGMFLNTHLERVFGKHSGSSASSRSTQV